MICDTVFGGSLFRSVRKALTPKLAAQLLVVSLVGLSFQASAQFSMSTEKILEPIFAVPDAFEPEHVWRFDEDQNDEWTVRDTDINSSTYGGDIPVEAPDPDVLCPALQERYDAANCSAHPYVAPNGCGASDFVGFLIPEQIPGTPVDITNACNDHDSCYGKPGTNRATCDMQIGNSIRELCREGYQLIVNDCDSQGGGSQERDRCIRQTTDRCNGASLLYEGGVQSYGHQPFALGQIAGVCLEIKNQMNTLDCP
jgi:hypothetical protein